MKIVYAVFEKGIFRPTEPVDLPEGCTVSLQPKMLEAPKVDRRGLDEIYAILGECYDSGCQDAAERHDEH